MREAAIALEIASGGISALVTLGLYKAFLEPISRQGMRIATDRILRALPLAYPILDLIWADLEQDLPPEELEAVVRRVLGRVTGEDWSRRSVDAFFELQDARIAAERRGSATPEQIAEAWELAA